MTAMLEAASYTFRFVVIYRVPPSDVNKLQKSLFVEQLADYLELAATLLGKLILIGDFNVHWDSVDDSEDVKLATLLDSYNLVQHVTGPTHKAGHTLDLVISRKEDDLVASCDTGDFVSDHNTIRVTLNCSRKHPPRKTVTYRNVKSINRSTLDMTSHLPSLCLRHAWMMQLTSIILL